MLCQNALESRLNFPHELLLLAYYHSWSADPHPCNQSFGIVKLSFTYSCHYIASNEYACAAKTSSAVDSHSLALTDVSVHDTHEFGNDVVLRVTAIGKLKAVNFNPSFFKWPWII